MDMLTSIGNAPSVSGQGSATTPVAGGASALFNMLLAGLLSTPAAGPAAGSTEGAPMLADGQPLPEGLSSEDLAALLAQMQAGDAEGAAPTVVPAGPQADGPALLTPDGAEALPSTAPANAALSNAALSNAGPALPKSNPAQPAPARPAAAGGAPTPVDAPALPLPAGQAPGPDAAAANPALGAPRDDTRPGEAVATDDAGETDKDEDRALLVDMTGAAGQPVQATSTVLAVPALPTGGEALLPEAADRTEDPEETAVDLAADLSATASASPPAVASLTTPSAGTAAADTSRNTKPAKQAVQAAGSPRSGDAAATPPGSSGETSPADPAAATGSASGDAREATQTAKEADRPQQRRGGRRQGPEDAAGPLAGQQPAQPHGPAKPVAGPSAAPADSLLTTAVGGTAATGGHGAETATSDQGQTSSAPVENTATLATAHDPVKQAQGEFAQHLSAARQNGRGSPVPPPLTQMAVQVHRAMQDGVDRLSIQLRPADLGRVDVRIEFGEGRLRAQVMADNPYTLDLLQKDAKALERALQDVGLQTDSNSLSFSLRDHGQQAQQNQQDSSGKGFAFRVAGADGRLDDLPTASAALPVLGPGRVDVRI